LNGNCKDALKYYHRARKIKKNEADAYYNIAKVLSQNIAHVTKAEKYYLKAIELNPKDAYALNRHGYLLEKSLKKSKEAKERYYQAIEAVKKIQEGDKKDAPQPYYSYYYPYYYLSDLLLGEGRKDDAYDCFNEAIDTFENILKDKAQFENILKDKPYYGKEFIKLLFSLISKHIERGNNQETNKYADRASRLMSSLELISLKDYYNAARLSVIMKDPGAALDNLEKAVKENPSICKLASNDSILKALHNEKRFKEIIGE
jgi:tetratricopeptide (TPR) repeat protein